MKKISNYDDLIKNLLDTKFFSKSNGNIYVKQHFYMQASNYITNNFKGIVKIKPVIKTGANGRTIYTITVNQNLLNDYINGQLNLFETFIVNDLNVDIDYIYNKYYKHIIDQYNNEGILYLDKLTEYHSFSSTELKSNIAIKTNAINPCEIIINDLSYNSPGTYEFKKNLIYFNILNSVYNFINGFGNYKTVTFKNYIGNLSDLSNNLKYSEFEPILIKLDQIESFYNEFKEERIKGTIGHELTHWIDNILNNAEFMELNKFKYNKRYLHYLEINALVNNVYQYIRNNNNNNNDLKYVLKNLPSIRTVYAKLDDDDKILFKKRLLKRLNREGITLKEDEIKGGKSDNMTLKQIADHHKKNIKDIVIEYNKGIKVEKEHTDSIKIAKEIAKDHIYEDPLYYTKLSKAGLADELDEQQLEINFNNKYTFNYQEFFDELLTKEKIKLTNLLNKELLYHGTSEDDVNEYNVNLNHKFLYGLYCTTDYKVAKDYGNNILIFGIKENVKIFDMSDGENLLSFIVKNKIFDKDILNDVDFQNYVTSGNLFQLFTRSGMISDYVNNILDFIIDKYNPDIVKMVDNLGGRGDNTAFIILNKDCLIPYQELIKNEIMQDNKIFKDKLNLNEVRVVNPRAGSYDDYNNFFKPNKASEYPLKDNEVIRVYHGFNGNSRYDSIKTILYGLSGKDRAKRIYSYEYTNNPKGLFVSINFNIVKRNFAGSGIIIEFATKMSDLEAPVWVDGRSYFVQGEYTKSFNSDEEREEQRLKNRERELNNLNPNVSNSDRPELAQTLFDNSENQALFIGDLNPNMISHVWVHEGRLFHNTTKGEWVRMTRKNFINKYKDFIKKSLYNDDKYYGLEDDRINNRIFKPADDYSEEKVKEWFGKKDYGFNTYLEFLKNKDIYHVKHLFWPKQIEQIKKIYNFNEEVNLNEYTISPYNLVDSNNGQYRYKFNVNDINYNLILFKSHRFQKKIYEFQFFVEKNLNFEYKTNKDIKHFNNVIYTIGNIIKNFKEKHNIDGICFESNSKTRADYYSRFFVNNFVGELKDYSDIYKTNFYAFFFNENVDQKTKSLDDTNDEYNPNEIINESTKLVKKDIEIEYHKSLNKKLWIKDKLKKTIKTKLTDLTNYYMKRLDLDVKIYDIIFTGSLANFNYTNLSDIDLHIIIKYKDVNEDEKFVKDYFLEKKKNWSDSNDIKILDYPVEIFVQDLSEIKSKAMGAMYSLKTDSWIKKPKYEIPEIDKKEIKEKINKIITNLNEIEKQKDSELKIKELDKIMNNLKITRRKSTSEEGEYSVDNLVFKFLRNKKIINKIQNIKKQAIKNVFSLK
jgi:predicted nucleotidyltransferase